MGDHRISLTIRAEFHGKTYEIRDAWWNYNGHNGVDSRVIHFFERMWEDGCRRFYEEEERASAKQRAENERTEELAELTRLKAKYEPTG